MNNCLWCDEEIVVEQLWSTFFVGKMTELLCEQCLLQLETIEGTTCLKCFKNCTSSLCNDCTRWEQYFSGNDPLIKNISSYKYNDFMKEVIARWKYRGDYTLGNIFYKDIKQSIKKHFDSVLKESYIIPIPLSEKRLYERAFNQSYMIATMITEEQLKIKNVLQRVHSEKQSKKTRTERIFTKNPFKLRKSINKSVILVDDIYTTGTTIRHAANLLVANGCPAVYSYTLIRG